MTSDDYVRYNLEREQREQVPSSAIGYRRELVNEHGIGVLHMNANSPSRVRAFEEFI
jgi:hypothetical protein